MKCSMQNLVRTDRVTREEAEHETAEDSEFAEDGNCVSPTASPRSPPPDSDAQLCTPPGDLEVITFSSP